MDRARPVRGGAGRDRPGRAAQLGGIIGRISARRSGRGFRDRRQVRAGRRRGRRDRRHRDRRGHADRRRLQDQLHHHQLRRRRSPAGWRTIIPQGFAEHPGADLVRGAGDDGAGLHPDGLRHPDHRQLHHHGHGRGADPGATRRAAAGRALLRLLLRRARRHHATGGAGGLCGGGHGRQRPVQDRQHGVPARPRPRCWCRSCSCSRPRCCW